MIANLQALSSEDGSNVALNRVHAANIEIIEEEKLKVDSRKSNDVDSIVAFIQIDLIIMLIGKPNGEPSLYQAFKFLDNRFFLSLKYFLYYDHLLCQPTL